MLDKYTPMAYICPMLIIETPVFTKRVLEALTDDEYRELQHFIAEHPEAGNIIPGSRAFESCGGQSQARESGEERGSSTTGLGQGTPY